MTDDLLEKFKNSNKSDLERNAQLEVQVEEIHSRKEDFGSEEESSKKVDKLSVEITALGQVSCSVDSNRKDGEMGEDVPADTSRPKNQMSNGTYWDNHNKHSTEIANYDFCTDNRSENHLNTTNPIGSNCSELNFQASLEIMSKLELENVRLNEKLERLKLKEETSSFLSLTESQKLKHDIARIEEINFRLRKVLAERITRERELQEKIEQLQADLEAGQLTDQKNVGSLRADDLKYYRIIECFRDNIYSVVRHEEEQRKQLERKIDTLLTNFNEIKKYEVEMVEKLRQDDFTIKNLLKKLVITDHNLNGSTSNLNSLQDLGANINKDIIGLEKENELLRKEKEKAICEINNLAKATYKSSKATMLDQECKSEQCLEMRLDALTTQLKSQLESVKINRVTYTDVEKNVGKKLSPIMSKSNSISNSIKQENALIEMDTTPNLTNFSINSSIHSTPKFDVLERGNENSVNVTKLSTSKMNSHYSVNSSGGRKLEIVPKEQCHMCGTNFYQSLLANDNKEFVSDMTLSKCYTDRNSLDTDISGKEKIRASLLNSTELLTNNLKDSSRIALRPNESNIDIPNKVESIKLELKGAQNNAKLSDSIIENSITLENSIQSKNVCGSKDSTNWKIKEDQNGLGVREIEMATQTDRFYESKLDSLEKYILKLEEQLKAFETKITIREQKKFDSGSKIEFCESKCETCTSSKPCQNHVDNLEQGNRKVFQVNKRQQQSFESKNSVNEKFSPTKGNFKQPEVNSSYENHMATGSYEKFHSVEDCFSEIVNCDQFFRGSAKKLHEKARVKPESKLQSSHKSPERKAALKIPATHKCPCQDSNDVKTEINFFSASMPALMSVKFLDNQTEGNATIRENTCSYQNTDPKTQSKGHCNLSSSKPLTDFISSDGSSMSKGQKNIEKYLIQLGKRCYYIESHLKIQQKQFEFLQANLKVQNSARNKENIVLNKKGSTGSSNGSSTQEIPDTRDNKCFQHESSKRKMGKTLNLAEGKSLNEINKVDRELDHNNYKTLEKYISKLCSYMQDMEACLKIQENIQTDLLDVVRSSTLIKTNVIPAESLKAVLTPSAALNETQSNFNEHISRSPSEDEYFMIKACSSKELLIDNKFTLSDIFNRGFENVVSSKSGGHEITEKVNAKTERSIGGENPQEHRIGFQIIESHCSNLAKQLKVIEANLKYQDAIYHFLQTCLQKNNSKNDSGVQTSATSPTAKKTNRTQSLDCKTKRKRKTSKVLDEKKSNSTENIVHKSESITNTPFADIISQTEACKILGKEPNQLKSEIQGKNSYNIRPSLNPIKVTKKESSKDAEKTIKPYLGDLQNHSEASTKLPSLVKETSEEKSVSKKSKSFDIQSPNKKLSDQETDISEQKKIIPEEKDTKSPSDMIHKMIQRIERNTILLEKRLNCINMNLEDKDEIYRCLTKLLKEKQLVSECIKENSQFNNDQPKKDAK